MEHVSFKHTLEICIVFDDIFWLVLVYLVSRSLVTERLLVRIPEEQQD